MLSTGYEVAEYLLKKNLLSKDNVVNGNLLITDISRRNRNFKVSSGDGMSYFIKQGLGEEKMATISNEALFYNFLKNHFGTVPKCFSPDFYFYDPTNGILVLELKSRAIDLRQYHLTKKYFSKTLCKQLGKHLGTIHRISRNVLSKAELENFSKSPPWILSIHTPSINFLFENSVSNIELVKIIQYSKTICQNLEALLHSWNPTSLIHNDLKWDNCIVFSSTTQSNRFDQLNIIDWEVASQGDPCWDIGSIFSDFLGFWVLSIPVTQELPISKYPDKAQFPLSKMQPAINSFWLAYLKESNIEDLQSTECLKRSIQFAAARLLQLAFEQMQMSSQLTGNIIFLVQLSSNMFSRPLESAIRLLGLKLSPE